MFKKEPSENEASPELTELAAPAGPVQKSDPAPVGNTMLLIGAIPLVLFLVAAVIGDRIIGLVLFVLAAIGFFIMWKKATGALSSSLGALRDEAFAVANDDLPRLGQALSSGAPISELSNTRQPVTFEDPDFASVASGLTAVRESAAGIGDNVSALQSGISDTFVNLARRNQALVDRQLEAIDTLEAEERDSDRLSLLYRVDHLATRMHRNAESLLVLADAKTPERHSPAVALREIIRVAIGEVEDYRRIVPISLDEVNVAGHKAQDMAHLLAELMENAAQHSPPGTAVDVTGVQNTATGDYTITILDHGTGLAADQLVNLNTLLERPPASTLTISHSIGLQVVSRISHSLGIRVRLDHGEDGGVVATVTVPSAVVNTWSKVVPGQVGEPVNETAAPIAPPVAPTAPLAPIPDLQHQSLTLQHLHRSLRHQHQSRTSLHQHRSLKHQHQSLTLQHLHRSLIRRRLPVWEKAPTRHRRSRLLVRTSPMTAPCRSSPCSTLRPASMTTCSPCRCQSPWATSTPHRHSLTHPKLQQLTRVSEDSRFQSSPTSSNPAIQPLRCQLSPRSSNPATQPLSLHRSLKHQHQLLRHQHQSRTSLHQYRSLKHQHQSRTSLHQHQSSKHQHRSLKRQHQSSTPPQSQQRPSSAQQQQHRQQPLSQPQPAPLAKLPAV